MSRSTVLRQLLSPRWIGLSIAALAVLAGFGWLSHWQWERAHRDEVTAVVKPVGDVLDAKPLNVDEYGAPVAVIGSYVPDSARLVARDSLWWVVAAVRTNDGVVPVVLGATTKRVTPTLLGGAISVTGLVQPFEGDPGPQPGQLTLPADEVRIVSASTLAQTWSARPLGGWVAAQTVLPSNGLSPITPVYDQSQGSGLRLQNATYAAQWTAFALFVIFLWARWFLDDLRAA